MLAAVLLFPERCHQVLNAPIHLCHNEGRFRLKRGLHGGGRWGVGVGGRLGGRLRQGLQWGGYGDVWSGGWRAKNGGWRAKKKNQLQNRCMFVMIIGNGLSCMHPAASSTLAAPLTSNTNSNKSWVQVVGTGVWRNNHNTITYVNLTAVTYCGN